MSLNAASVNEQVSSSVNAAANLTLSCQGIINTHIAPTDSSWYVPLNSELQQAQALAQEWQNQYATKLKSDVLTCVVHCGQAFSAARMKINQLFEQAPSDLAGAKAGLQTELAALKAQVQLISSTVSHYNAALQTWGMDLERVHAQMANTVGQIQAQANNLQSQIAAIKSSMDSLQSEIIKDRQAIAEAEAKRSKGTVETIFGIVFAPFTGGLSLIIAGIGVSSIAEADSKVSVMESTINNYQARIISYQQNLAQDQAQLVSLQGLTLSTGIALSDIEVAEAMLDTVRTSWNAFLQEIDNVIAKIANAQNADAIIVEKAWFAAACNEWELIVANTQGMMNAPMSLRTITCNSSDVPVIRVVPTASHPPLPPNLKVDPSTGPDDLGLAPDCPVLTWGDYTYWAVDYVDNRVGMCILAFDTSNRIVKQIEKQGARYIWKMVLDQANKTLTCYGQANRTLTVTFEEIQVA